MRNLLLVLSCFAYNTFLNAEGYSKAAGISMSDRRGGGIKDGRGVGGGYAGHVKDVFVGVTLELVELAGDSDNLGEENNHSKLSTLPIEKQDFVLDAEKIVDFINQGKLRLVQEGDAYTPAGVSYNIVDGALYINSSIWDRKIMENGYESEVIRLLMMATEQPDVGGKVSKHYGEILKAKKFKDTFFKSEIEREPTRFFE